MSGLTRSSRGFLAIVVLLILVAMVAIPALAADPSGAPGASASAEASKAPKPSKVPKQPKAERVPAVEVTVTGTVATRTDADGDAEYTITVDGRVLTLDAGPSWFFKDAHPLRAFVGKRVTIVGSQRTGSAEVDVETVDGTRLRAPGKPPWAGGWKAVGKDHPGWSQEKADRWELKQAERAERFGSGCFPPGQCTVRPGKGGAASPAP